MARPLSGTLTKLTKLSSRFSRAFSTVSRQGAARLSLPRGFPGSGWTDIDPCSVVEEENIPSYRPDEFYPVHIGEVFNGRYQVAAKLGPYQSGDIYSPGLGGYHVGQSCFRGLIETFPVQNPSTHGSDHGLVHPPLGLSLSLDQLVPLLPNRVMTDKMVRTTVRKILAALDFLHTEAHIIHTDIQPNNLLLGIKDESILAKFEKAIMEQSEKGSV